MRKNNSKLQNSITILNPNKNLKLNKELQNLQKDLDVKDIKTIKEERKKFYSQLDKGEVIRLYRLITSNDYIDQKVEDMIIEIEWVKTFLLQQSYLYNFKGVLKEIHSSILAIELDRFSKAELKAYAKMMGIELTHVKSMTLLKNIIITSKYRHLEILRKHSFIETALMSDYDQKMYEFGGTLNFFPNPNYDDIENNGISHYYPTIGELTIEKLVDRYDYYELFHMVANTANMQEERNFVLRVGMTKKEMAAYIMFLLEYLSADPRNVLTLLNARVIHNFDDGDSDYSLSTYNLPSVTGLLHAASQFGVKLTQEDDITAKPLYIVKEEFAKVVLNPSFYMTIEYHRDPLSACSHSKTIDGFFVDELDYGQGVYYGIGDGKSQYHAFTYEELWRTFKKHKKFYDPITLKENKKEWETFNLCAIRRLRYIMLDRIKGENRFSKFHKKLKDVIDEILDIENPLEKEFEKDLKLLQIENELSIQKGITKGISYTISLMYNVGSILSDWDQFVVKLGPEELRNKPLADWYEPYWQLELRNKLNDMIYRIIRSISKFVVFSNMRYIKFYDEKFHYNFDDELETIYGNLNLLLIYISRGLFDRVRINGNHLMSTASYYNKIIMGKYIGDIELLIDGDDIEL